MERERERESKAHSTGPGGAICEGFFLYLKMFQSFPAWTARAQPGRSSRMFQQFQQFQPSNLRTLSISPSAQTKKNPRPRSNGKSSCRGTKATLQRMLDFALVDLTSPVRASEIRAGQDLRVLVEERAIVGNV